MSLEEGVNLHKMNKWCKLLLGGFAGAAIAYAIKKHMCCKKFLLEALKSFSTPFKPSQVPPKVKHLS